MRRLTGHLTEIDNAIYFFSSVLIEKKLSVMGTVTWFSFNPPVHVQKYFLYAVVLFEGIFLTCRDEMNCIFPLFRILDLEFPPPPISVIPGSFLFSRSLPSWFGTFVFRRMGSSNLEVP